RNQSRKAGKQIQQIVFGENLIASRFWPGPAMKRILAIGSVVALAGAANAQFSRPDTGFARSLSDQFIVHGATQTSPSAIERRLATNVNYLELAPARLAISSERIKQAGYRELGDASAWRGRIQRHV